MSQRPIYRNAILKAVYDVPKLKDPCKTDVEPPQFKRYRLGGLIDAWSANNAERRRLLFAHNKAAMDLAGEACNWKKVGHFKLAMLFDEAAAKQFMEAGKYGYPKWEREVRGCLEIALDGFGAEERLRWGLVTPDFIRAKARVFAQMRKPIYTDGRDFSESAKLERKEADMLAKRIISDPEYRAWVRLCLLQRSVMETDATFMGQIIGSIGRSTQIGEMEDILPTAILVVPKKHAEEVVNGFGKFLRSHDRADFGNADLFCEARVAAVCKAALDARAARP